MPANLELQGIIYALRQEEGAINSTAIGSIRIDGDIDHM